MSVKMMLYFFVGVTTWFDCAIETESPACLQREHEGCVASGFDGSSCTPSEYSEGLSGEDKPDLEFVDSDTQDSFVVDYVWMERIDCSKGGDCTFQMISTNPIFSVHPGSSWIR